MNNLEHSAEAPVPELAHDLVVTEAIAGAKLDVAAHPVIIRRKDGDDKLRLRAHPAARDPRPDVEGRLPRGRRLLVRVVTSRRAVESGHKPKSHKALVPPATDPKDRTTHDPSTSASPHSRG
ncbi:MAG: hypothetical protein AMXMBFR56_79980 [Polyangiaceae bacterium]